MTQTLVDLISHYGYALVFLGVGVESMGVPVPGETMLVVAAALAGRGHLDVGGVALAGWLGAVVGDNAGYSIGRRWGRQLTETRGVQRVYSARRLAAADRFFGRRRGWLAVFLARFVALLRIFAGPLAGMHRMSWRAFVLANAAGAALWIAMVTAVGFLVGDNLDAAVGLVSRLGYGGAAIAVALGLGWVGVHRYRHRRGDHGRDEA